MFELSLIESCSHRTARLGVIALCSIIVGIPGISRADQPQPEAKASQQQIVPPSPDQLRAADMIAQGQELFVTTCAYCHGERGDSGKVATFGSRHDWDPQKIHDTIFNGRIRGANIMPSWKDSFSDTEIWKIVSYIKSLSADFPGPLPAPQSH